MVVFFCRLVVEVGSDTFYAVPFAGAEDGRRWSAKNRFSTKDACLFTLTVSWQTAGRQTNEEAALRRRARLGSG